MSNDTESKRLRRWICRLRRQLQRLESEPVRAAVIAAIVRLQRQLNALHSPSGEDCA